MSWDAWAPDVKTEEDPTWGDYGQVLKSGAGSMVSGTAGVLRSFYEAGKSQGGSDLWRAVEDVGQKVTGDAEEGMTKEGRDRFTAGITSEKFWEHPASSMAMKATGQVPNLVAMALPGRVINEARLAIGASIAIGGMLSAGDVVDGVYKKVDKLSDNELKDQSPLYRGLRADSDEEEARRQYVQTLLGMKPAIAFALGAGSDFFGPVANVIRGVKGVARPGIIKAAGEAAVGETVDEGYGAYAGQKAEIEGGLRKDFDIPAIIDQALTGGAVGGLLGSVSGVGGGKGKAKTDEIAAKRGSGEEDTAVQAPAQVQGQPAAPTPDSVAAAATEAKQAKAQVKGVEIVQPNAPSASEGAALAANETQAKPKVEPVVPPVQPSAPPAQAAPVAPATPPVAPAPPVAQNVAPAPPSAPLAQQGAPPQVQGAPTGAPPGAPTDISAQSRGAALGAAAQPPSPAEIAVQQRAAQQAPVTPGVTPTPGAPAPVAQAAPVAPVQQEAAPVSAPTAEQAAPAPTGRVLPNISDEAQANAAAQAAQQKKNVKEATAGEKEVGKQKLKPIERDAQAERAKHAEEVFNEHHEPIEMPAAPAARKALAEKLQGVLDAAAKRGLVPRESLPQHIRDYFGNKKGRPKGLKVTDEERVAFHRSIPEKVANEGQSPYVRYLREAIGIRKALLGNKFGPTSNERARVAQFITEHNAKDLESLAARRKEEGDAAARVFQGTVEENEGVTQKGKVSQEVSQGAASVGEKLGDNAKAAMAAEVLARVAAREKSAEAAKAEFERDVSVPKTTETPAAEPAAKPMPEKVAAIVKKSKTSVQEKADAAAAASAAAKARVAALAAKGKAKAETKAEAKAEAPAAEAPGRLHLPPTEIHDGIAPDVVKLIERRNEVRKQVEDLSDEDYAKINRNTHLTLVDANSMRSVETAAQDINQQLGIKEKPAEPVREVQKKAEPEKVTPEVTEAEQEAETADEEVKGPSTGTVKRESLEEKRAADKEAAEIAARAAAAAARKAANPVKPRANSEQIKAAVAAMKAKQAGDKSTILKNELSDEDLMSRDQALAELEALVVRERGDAAPRGEMLLSRDEYDIWDTPLHKTRDLFGHDEDAIAVEQGMLASDVLDKLNLDHLTGVPKYVADFMRRRLSEIMGDIRIYIADESLIRDAVGERGTAPGGYYHPGAGAHGKDYIVINSNTMGVPGGFAHTVIHEAVHHALVKRLDGSKRFFERIHTLATELDKQLELHRSDEDIRTARYGLSDPHEFVAEVLSNPRLQELMAHIRVSPELVKALGLGPSKPWTLWGAFTDKVREMLRLPPGANNLLDQVLRVASREMEQVRAFGIEKSNPIFQTQSTEAGFGALSPIRMLSRDALQEAAIGRAADAKVNLGGNLRRIKDRLSTTWNMAQRHVDLFGPSNPLNRLFDLRAKMERAKDQILEKYGGLRTTMAIAKAERSHPDEMARAKEILFELSLHDIDPTGANEHLGKDAMMGVQAKEQIPRLQQAWADPTLNPVRKTLEDAVKFYKDIHNATAQATIKNILSEANIYDAGLADRIYKNGLTETDRENFAHTKLVDALDQVAALKQRKGWYVPFRRFGDFSTTANHELAVPGNATKVNDNTLQFVDPKADGETSARNMAKAYLKQAAHTSQGNQLTPVQVRKVWVDKNDTSQIVEAEDENAIPAFHVAMQTQHTEMHATEALAKQNAKELTDAGLVGARTHKREEAYSNSRDIQGAMGTILRSLEQQQRFKDADSTQKAAMREMFHDLTLGLSGTTSVKTSMKARRNVAGMSHDLGRVTADYARMTSNYLAKLQYRPEIDKVFAEMRAYNKEHVYDKDNIRREEVYQEFVNRIYGKDAAAAEEHKPGAVKRLLQVSRLARLAGVSFHVINAHEPWTTSMPVIGGRHGMVHSIRALKDIYNLIGARGGVAAGLRDTARAFTTDTGFTDYVKLFKDSIARSNTLGGDKANRLMSVLDYMNERNLFGNEAVFEVGKFANPNSNIAGRALDRADLMANQVGSAIEAINRTVTGLAAYNLEYRKNGGNHEAAMHYAYSTAHDTMGDYSNWNAAPMFNTGLGRLALQFKKFGQKTYYLLGKTMGNALRGDREAQKQFVGLLVTHGMVAGALGMPTEPFKLALMAANMMGLGFTPDDYDNAVRQLAARVAGQKGGEIISKGLYRGIGIEVSGRMGFDSLATYGAPKTQKANDIKAWLFDTMAGAPAGWLLDQVAAAQALAKGDVATAIEKASPIRAVSDITKAVVGVSGPKKGPTGREINPALTPWETAVRAVGFTPSSTAEAGAMRGNVAREGRRLSEARGEVVNTWVTATGASKVDAQRAVQRWNANHTGDERIQQKDLVAAARRRANEDVGSAGIRIDKRTKAIYERAESTYNP